MHTRLLVDIPTAQEMLGGISRSSLYGLVRAGKLHLVHVGRRAMLYSGELQRLVDELAADAGVHAEEIDPKDTLQCLTGTPRPTRRDPFDSPV